MWPNPFATSTIVDTKIYYPQRNTGTASVNGTTSISSWQIWQKPNGCSFVYMLIIASGGGGGRASDGATTSAGAGGGSGGHTRVMLPAMFLPETLYVWPGSGGLGGAAALTTGAQGQPSIISCEPQLSASNVAATSTTANYVLYQLGGFGGASATGTGIGGTAGTIGNQQIASSGLWFSIGGQGGSAGAATTNGTGSSISGHNSGIITTGGAGGGNGTGPGGAVVLGTGPHKVNISASTSGQAGKDGVGYNEKIEHLISRGIPIYFSGGTGGGGSQTAAAGGKGGNAGYGGGGGGGGSSTTAGALSGNGGDGGDGLIIIMSW